MIINKVKNTSPTQAMKWDKMCIQDFFEIAPSLAENANVWAVSKYHDFYKKRFCSKTHATMACVVCR